MKLSVIMPVFNEKDTIRDILRKVSDVALEKEIIIVDDGSTDGTVEILKKIEKSNVRFFSFQQYGEGRGYPHRFKICFRRYCYFSRC